MKSFLEQYEKLIEESHKYLWEKEYKQYIKSTAYLYVFPIVYLFRKLKRKNNV